MGSVGDGLACQVVRSSDLLDDAKGIVAGLGVFEGLLKV